jgi:hypothetical protein
MAKPCCLSLRDALRDIWQADKYPILGNADWHEAERLMPKRSRVPRGP